MTADWNNPERAPTPEQLAAFADGELDPAGCARVEGWLLDHPEAAAEVEAQRHLLRLWQDHAPPEPSPAAWAATRARIDAALPAPRLRLRHPGYWLLGGLAAAALLAAVLLGRGRWHPQPAPQGPGGEPVAQEFEVATPEDVTFVSMDPRDADLLVVGSPPALGKVEFVTRADIADVHMEPSPEDGRMPHLSEVGVPLIMPPAAAAEDREP